MALARARPCECGRARTGASQSTPPGAPMWARAEAGTLAHMATSGPQHYKQAEQLLDEARFEKDETQRAKKVQEAQAHATLALVVATIHGGQVGQEQLHEWRIHGMKI